MLDRLSNEILLKVLQKCARIETLRKISKTNNFYEGFIERYKHLLIHAQHVNLGLSVKETNLSVVKYSISTLQKEYSMNQFDKDSLPSDHGAIICQLVKQFWSIENLGIYVSDARTFPIVLNSNFVNNWSNLNINVRKLKVTNLFLRCSLQEFVQFGKSVKEIFVKYTNSAEHLCDEVLCQIVPYTKFELIRRKTDESYQFEPDVQLDLSDKTLEAMIAGQTPSKFVNDAETKFTVNGIRNFTQGLIQLDRRSSCSIELGVLEANQKSDADEWLKLFMNSPLPYTIDETNYGDSISYKVTNRDHHNHYGLFLNKLEHEWTVSFQIKV